MKIKNTPELAPTKPAEDLNKKTKPVEDHELKDIDHKLQEEKVSISPESQRLYSGSGDGVWPKKQN